MMTKRDRIEKPWSVIILCLLAFMSTSIGIILFISTIIEGKSFQESAGYLIFSMALLFPFIGIYQMKKWGFYIYAILIIPFQAFSSYNGNWSPTGLIMPGIILTAFLVYFKELE